MFNKNTSSHYFVLFPLLILLCGACRSSKKISSLDPSYMNIDYDNTSSYIDWKGKSYRNISFNDKKEMNVGENLPLYVKTKFSKSREVRQLESVPLFILDTLDRTSEGYYHYVENPIYFEKLNGVRAHYLHVKGNTTVGKYKEELLNLGLSYQDIAFLLMQFGVIDTYDHLYSEMVIMKKIDTTDMHEIHYNCVYHMCTSKCFDPKYKFLIRFDKKTRMITINKV